MYQRASKICFSTHTHTHTHTPQTHTHTDNIHLHPTPPPPLSLGLKEALKEVLPGVLQDILPGILQDILSGVLPQMPMKRTKAGFFQMLQQHLSQPLSSLSTRNLIVMRMSLQKYADSTKEIENSIAAAPIISGTVALRGQGTLSTGGLYTQTRTYSSPG